MKSKVFSLTGVFYLITGVFCATLMGFNVDEIELQHVLGFLILSRIDFMYAEVLENDANK